jgi:NADH dehydrogenase
MRRFIGDGRTRGPGGPRVLVLGGTGFVGRHAARALRDLGAAPIIGTRKAPRERTQLGDLVDDCAHRTLHLERLQSAADWGPELDGVDVVLNCVGILRPTGRATYDRVHHRAVAALAAACAGRDARLVHVSALGLDAPVRSRFLRSKRDGELALRASEADWYLVRPALLDGDGGYGAAWIRRVANWRVRCVPWNARGRLAPLDVRDLGLALARLCLAPPPVGPDPAARIFELGGPAERTMAEHLDALRDPTLPPAGAPWRIPGPLARVASHACDLLRWTPFSFGHHELMQRDNRPLPNRIEELIGRPPRAVRHAPESLPALLPVRARRLGA